MNGMRARAMLTLLLLVMIPGCGHGPAEESKITAPVVVELASVRCPAADPRWRQEFRQSPRPPETDVVHGGKPHVSSGAWKKNDDAMRVMIERKNRTGLAIIDEYERCLRTAEQPTS